MGIALLFDAAYRRVEAEFPWQRCYLPYDNAGALELDMKSGAYLAYRCTTWSLYAPHIIYLSLLR